MRSARWWYGCALLSLALAACGGSTGGSDGGSAVVDHCQSPAKVCGGTCVDVETDNANCGSCGNACAEGEVCAGGSCGTTCGPDLTRCTVTGRSDYCADTNVDPANCGSCGNACTAPTNEVGTCAGGTCSHVCQGGFADCDAAADGCETDVENDPANCGACGHVCPAGPGQVGTCTQGVCGSACAPGYADCNNAPFDGCEVDLGTDPANCGTCGDACPAATGPNQAASCSAGQCSVGCDSGYADCNSDQSDGCETPLGTLTDCAACADACATQANSAPVCDATSGCSLTCDTGYLDCNKDTTDGCEVDDQTDPQHCGTCDNACALEANTTAPTCTAGACVLGCSAGYADCDGDYTTGCEVDLNTDAANCGACNAPCTGSYVCIGGTCVPPPAGTLDQSFPYDPTSTTTIGVAGPVYQTYVASITGSLGQVAFWNAQGGGCSTYTLEVYEGAGTGGTLLGSLAAVQACNKVPGLFHVPLDVVIPQTVGQTYTLNFITTVGALTITGGYANGCSNARGSTCPGSSTWDANFQTWVR